MVNEGVAEATETVTPDAAARPGRLRVSSPLGYRPGLDGLRALAVAMVVVSHLDGGAQGGITGWGGVTVFFVLSGFLITRLMTEEHARTGRVNVRSFWRRRIARLIPAAFLVIGVVTIAELDWLRAIAAGSYLTNWIMLYGSISLEPLDHYWSLALEEQFYLLWPLLFVPLFLGRPRTLLVVAAMVAVWRATQPEPMVSMFRTDTRLDALLVGAAMAMLPLPTLSARWAAVGLAVVVAWMFLPFEYAATAGVPMVIGGTALLIVFAMHWTPPRIVTHLGVTSYGMYLWHWPLLAWLGPIGIPVAMAATEIMHRTWEVPMRRLLSGAAPKPPRGVRDVHHPAGD